jgi:hypothetical protein
VKEVDTNEREAFIPMLEKVYILKNIWYEILH